MSDTLVVIGHHKEEAVFGNLLKKFMEKDQGISFYSVINSYGCDKDGIYAKEDVLKVYNEIYDVMKQHKPKITIDVHTGDYNPNWWGAELFTNTEYDKLISLEQAVIGDDIIKCGKVYIPKTYQRTDLAPLLIQKQFPYAVFEMYFLHGEILLEDMTFAAKVIKDISKLYL